MQGVLKSFSFKYAIVMAVVLLAAYAFAWLFYGRYSFLLLFGAILISFFYLGGILNSITFWIKNRKKYQQAYIPLCVNIAIVVLVFQSPSIYLSKRYPFGTYRLSTCKVCNCTPGLFLEYYMVVGGGYMTTDIYSVYLTDKKNFRVFLGTYDEADENISVECAHDRITATKTTSYGISTYWTPPIVLNRYVFTLTELKLKHIDD